MSKFTKLAAGAPLPARKAAWLATKDILWRAGVLGGAGLVIGTGAAAGNAIKDNIQGRMNHREGLRDMLARNPVLKKADQTEVKSIYGTLFNLARPLAMDPNVSGAFVKRQLEYGDVGIQLPDAAMMIKADKDHGDARRSTSSIFDAPSSIAGTKWGDMSIGPGIGGD